MKARAYRVAMTFYMACAYAVGERLSSVIEEVFTRMATKSGRPRHQPSGKASGGLVLPRKNGTAAAKRPKRKSSKIAADSEPVLGFRPRTSEDDDYILQLTESQLASVHQQSFGEPFPREQFLRYVQSGAPTVIVERRKKRIGYYSYLVSPDGKMHVSALVIEPAHQSDGIGTTVMKKLEDDAQANGVHTLEVFVQGSNAKSMAFTKKLGFIEVYRVTPDTICFQKPVTPAARMENPLGGVSPQPSPYNFG
jgi:GNAT superfamily N-acetyltransferase